MAFRTGIQWCHHTWSPWIGCAKVSPGCQFCYAEAEQDLRYHRAKWGVHGTRHITSIGYWRNPLRWEREALEAGERRRVFPSLCDPLEDRPDLDAPLGQFLELVARTPGLDYLWLTKRPELWSPRLQVVAGNYRGGEYERERGLPTGDVIASAWLDGEAPPNIWMGASVENADYLHRIDRLQTIPARVLFLSIEPLIGPLPTLREHLDGIDWVIVGGESGPHARPCEIDWIRYIVGQCELADVACFVKQLGAVPIGFEQETAILGAGQFPFGNGSWRRLAHPKGGDPDEWPEDLRGIRQFPDIPAAAS